MHRICNSWENVSANSTADTGARKPTTSPRRLIAQAWWGSLTIECPGEVDQVDAARLMLRGISLLSWVHELGPHPAVCTFNRQLAFEDWENLIVVADGRGTVRIRFRSSLRPLWVLLTAAVAALDAGPPEHGQHWTATVPKNIGWSRFNWGDPVVTGRGAA